MRVSLSSIVTRSNAASLLFEVWGITRVVAKRILELDGNIAEEHMQKLVADSLIDAE